MFKTIEEVLKEYKTELRRYKRWTKKLGIKNDEDARGKLYPNKGQIGPAEDRRIQAWNTRIDGMRDVLGLSKIEIESIEKEIGIRLFNFYEPNLPDSIG